MKYALKVISSQNLTDNARNYVIEAFMHLTLLYPYLVTSINEHLLDQYNVESSVDKNFADELYKIGLKTKNYEAMAYALFFATKYNFYLTADDYIEEAECSEDCVLLCLAFLYSKTMDYQEDVNKLTEHAKVLSETEFDRFWLFIYEILPEEELEGDWQDLKAAGVSFLVGNE